MSDTFNRAVEKLERYAYARNRSVDREPRTIAITDDEAVALLAVLATGAAPDDGEGDD